ncbi:Uncharacterised protein [Candidatus Tiddalikarchaeum anstoanum]|nr:Uncharacterised protein [Candidatus Tiddalikarchaeum anstoanum]
MSELFRKIWHAGSGILLAFIIYYLGPTFFQAVAISVIIFLMIIRVLKSKNYTIPLIDNYLSAFGRGRELGDTAMYFLLGAFIATLFFEKSIAAVSVLVLGVSDALATLVGIHGRHKLYKKKTLEGSTAFFISSFLIINYFYGFFIAIIAGLSSTLVELFGGFDDNIVIPPLCSLIIQLLKII